MANNPMWMVRAGEKGYRFGDCKENSVVAIGWGDIGDLNEFRSREELSSRIQSNWPDWSKGTVAMSAGQVWRFFQDIKPGDKVLTYDPARRVYLVGTVLGNYEHMVGIVEDLPNIRRVKWDGEVSRDAISVSTKNSLGAISTLFRISEEGAKEIESLVAGKTVAEHTTIQDEIAEEKDVLRDIQARSHEFIKDELSKLDWEQMQRLIAGLLRAMGYKTRISPQGPDRGKDIIASPDGFGFEAPRIVVEVKHRRGAMGSQEIRSFVGGRHKDDKGLYVSTGGFTKDAQYEAERSSIPLTLMDLDEIADAITDHYETMDSETRALLPLTRIYWPT